MLHNTVIDSKSGFRALDMVEIEAVSGGNGGMLHKDASPIVVEAVRTGMVDSDYYGFEVGGFMYIFKDTAGPVAEFFGAEDEYMGKFKAGTPDDHDLKLDEEDKKWESNNGLNITVGPASGGNNNGSSYESSSDTTQYWKRVGS